MTQATHPAPPLTALSDLDDRLRGAGFAVIDAAGLSRLCDVAVAHLDGWRPFWDALPPDAHLRDGGRYRQRRHGSFVVEGEQVRAVPQRAHWQPVEYNALHGGFERWFEPLPPALAEDAGFARLLAGIGRCASGTALTRSSLTAARSFLCSSSLGRPSASARRISLRMASIVGVTAAERVASPKLSFGALTAIANSSGDEIIFASRRWS